MISVFFLVCKARSGSTYLAELLNRHPQMCITFESNFVPRLWHWGKNSNRRIEREEILRECLKFIFSEAKFNVWGLEQEELFSDLSFSLPVRLSDVCLQIVNNYARRVNVEAQICGVKKGGWYALNLEIIWQLFPGAKFVHLVRDGRAVYASSKKAIYSETGRYFETNPVQSAVRWREIMTNTKIYADSSLYHELRYEDLLTTPHETMSSLLGFLGVENSIEQINSMFLPQQAQLVNTKIKHLHPNVGKKPQLARINAWQNELTEKEIRVFEQIAGDQLINKGYELLNSSLPPAHLLVIEYKLLTYLRRLVRHFKRPLSFIGRIENKYW